MPPTEVISAGGWVLEKIDTDSQTGVAKLHIKLPNSLNASKRTKACSLMCNQKRVQNANIRRGQLVIKYIVAARTDVDSESFQKEMKELVNLLHREITTNPRTGMTPQSNPHNSSSDKRDHESAHTPAPSWR